MRSRPIILFDVETASLLNAGEWVPAQDLPKMPSNYTKPDTIEKWHAELPAKVEALRVESLSRAALDPHVARIVVLGTDIDGVVQVSVLRTEDEEAAALRTLWALYHERQWPKLVGWWVKFDIRAALIRSRYLGVKAPAIDLHPYNSSDYLDLMELYDCGPLARGAEHVMSLSQDAVYKRLGGPELNDPIKGEHVPGCVAAGDYEASAAHNRADLARLRWIAEWLGVLSAQPVTA